MSDLRVMHSPLSNRIYAGRINKAGNAWAGNKADVTGDTCAAVAMRAEAMGGSMVITANGVPEYEITVKKLGTPPKEPPHE